MRDQLETVDQPAICLRLVKEAVADEDREVRAQVFDVDLVDVVCDGRLEGLFILPSQPFRVRGGVGAGDPGGSARSVKTARTCPVRSVWQRSV